MKDKVDEKILTLHPAGKQGVNISRTKYEMVREAIVRGLTAGELTFTELMTAVSDQLSGSSTVR